MKLAIVSILFLFTTLFLTAQTTKSIIDEVSADSLLLSLKQLTGEEVVDKLGIIQNRKTVFGREMASKYLKTRLESYGLETRIDNYRTGGNNVIAFQTGSLYPDSVFMICAHYDSVDEFCADDNASGTSAVLEAARILSKYKFEYSIVYALWDEEEKGLIGSYNYAKSTRERGEMIAGVINLDMIGYDGNNDYLFEVHIGFNPKNIFLSDKVTSILTDNKFDLEKSTQIPGTDRSDHYSFWTFDYPAIFLTEGFYTNDFNPTYHSSDDKIAVMSLDFHHQISQVAIASIFELANLDTISSVEDSTDIVLDIFPNPTSDFINLKKNRNVEINDIKIYELSGRELLSFAPDTYSNSIEITNLQSGMYLLVVNTATFRFTKAFIKI